MKLIMQKVRVLSNILRKRPILVIFDVTKLCNQRCPMCNIWKTHSEDMDLDKIQDMAQRLRRFGIGYVFLQGGDPLVRPNIVEIIDIFLAQGIRPTLITNGILLKENTAVDIAKRPCNLAVSIDSMIPERYAELRGRDTLELVKGNLRAIKGIPHKGNWSITTTVTKKTTLDDVKNIRAFAYENGFMYAIRPYIYVRGTAGRKDETLAYDYSDVLEIFQYIYKEAKKENIFASLIYEEHIAYMQGKEMPICDAARYSFLMKETGAIAPCIEFPDASLSLEHFDRDRATCEGMLEKCNRETPCFYNDAREIGFLWRKKWKILSHIPAVLRQMRRYGNFF